MVVRSSKLSPSGPRSKHVTADVEFHAQSSNRPAAIAFVPIGRPWISNADRSVWTSDRINDSTDRAESSKDTASVTAATRSGLDAIVRASQATAPPIPNATAYGGRPSARLRLVGSRQPALVLGDALLARRSRQRSTLAAPCTTADSCIES